VRIDWRRPRQMTYMSIPLRNESLRFCAGYPDAARRAGEEGQAVVTFIVTADGRMREPEIAQTSGWDDLDAAALSCISAYSYFPATQDGKPVEFEWRAAAFFSLR
jgi:protein TonB